MYTDVDWTHGADHMLEKHDVTVAQANEALRDPDRVVIQPDYGSRSGTSDRVIGYSGTFDDLLTVIVITNNGTEYGVNGWRSNSKDRRLYNET